MSTGIVHPTTPEEEELKRKQGELARLEAELAERELQLTSLHTQLRAFEVRYLRTVGLRYAELDQIEAQIAELQARLSPRDQEAQDKVSQARTRAAESQTAADLEGPQYTPDFHALQSLKSLYREVAKRVHPDLTVDACERARREQLMADANHAYESGNEAALRKILGDYESSPESIQGEGPGAELVRVIRKIDQVGRRLVAIEQEIEQLSRSDAFGLMIQVEEAARDDRDLLTEMAARVGERVAEARERLNSISRQASER
jgi:multidrug efflux pump subunit AcrA (membrane-fusion protein)